MASQTLSVQSASTQGPTARDEREPVSSRAQKDRMNSTMRKHHLGKEESASWMVDSMTRSRVPTRATPMTPTPLVSLSLLPGATITETTTQWSTVTLPVPPFATITPLSAREAYPNTRFGLEVGSFAVVAGMLAVGLTQLWRVLRH